MISPLLSFSNLTRTVSAVLLACLCLPAHAENKPALGYAVFARSEALLLAEADGPSAIPLLRATLDDDALLVRRTAAHVLSRLGEPAWDALRAGLANDDPEVRRIAAETLFDAGQLTDRVLDVLADPNPFVRQSAMRMLRSVMQEPNEAGRALARQLAHAVIHEVRTVRRTANLMLDTWEEALQQIVIQKSQRIPPHLSREDFEEYRPGDFQGQNPLWHFSLLDSAEIIQDPGDAVNPTRTLRLFHRGRTHLPIYECRGWGWPNEVFSGMLTGRFDVKIVRMDPNEQWDFYYNGGGSEQRAGVRFTGGGTILTDARPGESARIGIWEAGRWYRVHVDFLLSAREPESSLFRVRLYALEKEGSPAAEIGRSEFQGFREGAASISHYTLWFRRDGQVAELLLDNLVLAPMTGEKERNALFLDLFEQDRAAAAPFLALASSDASAAVRQTAARLRGKPNTNESHR